MKKFDFLKIFGWIPWITILILLGWVGLFVVDILHFGTKSVGVLVILVGLVFFTFAVDSLMKENRDLVKKYFIEWVIVSGMFIFFALTIYIFA